MLGGTSSHSPYCLVGEAPSTAPDQECSAYDGRLVFLGEDPDAPVEPPPGAVFVGTLAWWTWSPPG